MVSSPLDLTREPTEDDVLSIDPVVEYERRKVLREWAWRVMQDAPDAAEGIIERGRPTGP